MVIDESLAFINVGAPDPCAVLTPNIERLHAMFPVVISLNHPHSGHRGPF